MPKTRLILLSILSLFLIFVGQHKIDPLPPLGKFFNPFGGLWTAAESPDFVPEIPEDLAGLEAEAKVIYDERRVPHIFAENEHDLYFLQGYVTAVDRLWQMELQTHAAAGRLSEIFGKRALNIDKRNRRLGMGFGAERAMEMVMENPTSKMVMEAYVEGINAYISQLSYADYPIEYKLVDHQPETWTPLKTGLLLKYMAQRLSGRTDDIENSNSFQYFGPELYALIYPNFPDSASPIIPISTSWDFEASAVDTPFVDSVKSYIPELDYPEIDPMNGSNNWAISGSKTKSGSPILCNDPHLNLTLPAIWYEMQLHAPGINSYGVTLPGSPNVIIGFNEDAAWGITNSARDVIDWYKVEFQDESKKQYNHGGEWKETSLRIEEIKIRGEESVFDTVVYTDFGPVVYDDTYTSEGYPINLAMRWTAHDATNELLTFYGLNRMKNHDDYMNALDYYESPGQNIVFATRSGDIAIRQQGKYPVRWPGQGHFVMEAKKALHEWQDYIPFRQNPHVLNPERGFVSSANQHPTDANYPYDVSGIYEYFRNRVINEALDGMENITAEDMQTLQQNNLNLGAKEALPLMLDQLDKNSLSEKEQNYLAALQNWNFWNEANIAAPAYFQCWADTLHHRIWSDEVDNVMRPLNMPHAHATTELLKQKTDWSFIDNIDTPEKETFSQLVTESYRTMVRAISQWEDSLGPVTWANYKSTEILHLMRLRPFSRLNIQVGGNKSIVNAISKTAGPSWRMVVELNETPTAWGIYPAGQSGNPGSHFYDHMINDWVDGKYYPLRLMSLSDFEADYVLDYQEVKP